MAGGWCWLASRPSEGPKLTSGSTWRASSAWANKGSVLPGGSSGSARRPAASTCPRPPGSEILITPLLLAWRQIFTQGWAPEDAEVKAWGWRRTHRAEEDPQGHRRRRSPGWPRSSERQPPACRRGMPLHSQRAGRAGAPSASHRPPMSVKWGNDPPTPRDWVWTGPAGTWKMSALHPAPPSRLLTDRPMQPHCSSGTPASSTFCEAHLSLPVLPSSKERTCQLLTPTP